MTQRDSRRRSRRILMAAIAVAVASLPLSRCTPRPAHGVMEPEHQRLKIRNDFKTPEEVVKYYCGRDASGFVWSGLLEIERKAFTLWKDIPQHDSFLIARKYEIVPSRAPAGDRARVEVKYELTGMGDAHGTRTPPTQPEMRVVFDLQRVNGVWKIAKPTPPDIAPVVLESKFPAFSAQ